MTIDSYEKYVLTFVQAWEKEKERLAAVAEQERLTAEDAESTGEWLAYRQALRDFPELPGFPGDGGGTGTPWPIAPRA